MRYHAVTCTDEECDPTCLIAVPAVRGPQPDDHTRNPDGTITVLRSGWWEVTSTAIRPGQPIVTVGGKRRRHAGDIL